MGRVIRRFRQELLATLTVASPLVIAAVVSIGTEIVDTVMMGWLGKKVLAGGALVNALYLFLVASSAGLLSALGVHVATAVGSGKVKEIPRAVNQALLIVMMLTIPVMTLIWWSDDLFRMMGQPEEILGYTQDYAHYFVWCFLPIFLFLVCREILAGIGRPRLIMWVSLPAVPLNICLNYILMYGKFGLPVMGVKGIGLSTSFVSFLMFLSLFLYIKYHYHCRDYAIFRSRPSFDRSVFFHLVKVGWPAAFSYGFESSLFSITAILMGYFGTVALASHQIAVQVATFSFMVPYGISQAVAVRVGQAYGAQDMKGVVWATTSACFCGLLFALCSSTSFWLIPQVFVDIFLDLDNPTNVPVLKQAASFLAIAGLFQLVDCVQVLFFGSLRGLKDTFVPMLICVFSYSFMGLGSGSMLAFKFGFQGRGLWFGLAIGLGFSAMLMVMRYIWFVRSKSSVRVMPLIS